MTRTSLPLAAALLALAAAAAPAQASLSPERAALLKHRLSEPLAGPPSCSADAFGTPRSVQTDRTGHLSLFGDCQVSEDTTVTVTKRPAHGGLDTYVDELSVVYAPAKGFTGTDAVSFTLSNAKGTSPEYTASFQVGPVGDAAPHCFINERVGVHTGEARTIPFFCFDPDGTPLTVGISADGDLGDAAIVPGASQHEDSVLRYTAGQSEGDDVVQLKASDGTTDTTVSVAFDVHARESFDAELACFTSEGDEPRPVPALEPGDERFLFDVSCFDPDDDIVYEGLPAGLVAKNGFLAYTAPADAPAGERTLAFTARSHETLEVSTKVRVVAPQASPDCDDVAASTTPGTPVEVVVRCADAEGTQLYAHPYGLGEDHFQQVAAHGDVDVRRLKDGALRVLYRPDAGFTGQDGFRVSVDDEHDFNQEAATVKLSVAPPAVVPVAQQQQPAPPPAGPTPQQLAAAGKALVGQAASALAKQLTQGAKAVDPAKGELSLGTVGAKQLPNGGTVGVGVFAEPRALRGAAAKRAKPVALGTTSVVLAKGQSKAVKVKLGKKARAVLKKKRKLAVTVRLELTDALTKQSTTVTKKVVLKAKKAKGRR